MKKHCVAWQGGLEEVGRRVVGLLMRALHVRGLGWLTVGFRPRAFKVQDSELGRQFRGSTISSGIYAVGSDIDIGFRVELLLGPAAPMCSECRSLQPFTEPTTLLNQHGLYT